MVIDAMTPSAAEERCSLPCLAFRHDAMQHVRGMLTVLRKHAHIITRVSQHLSSQRNSGTLEYITLLVIMVQHLRFLEAGSGKGC